ncbi:hypothetical protein ACL02S_20445 [Nocardia sp. 004]|uniref:hypothetical protein n=1 Tax=Nocardia sp. 004 TaxID=3385978 RepID=UPI0039A3732D
MSLSTMTVPLRRLTRIAVAGTLIAIPLTAFASTASAETPSAAINSIQPVSAPGHDRPALRPEPGPRGPEHGPRVPGMPPLLPPTGSS